MEDKEVSNFLNIIENLKKNILKTIPIDDAFFILGATQAQIAGELYKNNVCKHEIFKALDEQRNVVNNIFSNIGERHGNRLDS